MTKVKDNVLKLKDEIASICKKSGRNPQEIVLVGVTKFAENDLIEQAIDSGITDIGENRVQEGVRKYTTLKIQGKMVRRHLIGHLQTNKVKDALKVFDLIQSVDSLKLAQEIEKQALKIDQVADVLVQVNASGETQKFGADKTDALALIAEMIRLKNIKIHGLMTIAPLTEDQKIIRGCFSFLRELQREVKKQFKSSENLEMKFLSMGMSGDYRIALEEGANMLRVGRAIFS